MCIVYGAHIPVFIIKLCFRIDRTVRIPGNKNGIKIQKYRNYKGLLQKMILIRKQQEEVGLNIAFNISVMGKQIRMKEA